jgi:hypothetical protein
MFLFVMSSSMRTTKSSSGSESRSSDIKAPTSFLFSRFINKLTPHKISPSTTEMLNPVTVLARSQLAVAESIRNMDEFCPPQEQPRAEKLKWVAALLQGAMFENKKDEPPMNEAIATVVEDHFVPVAQAHFAECVEQARDMVPEIRNRYQDVRQGHLGIYQDTLDQIRGEHAFAELQKRSDKLVKDCEELGRPKEQKTTSICDLYNGAEAVSTRYEALMVSIASKTATKFHAAPRKGLLRICEKLSLAPEWQPKRVLDVTRGFVTPSSSSSSLPSPPPPPPNPETASLLHHPS